MIKFYDQTQTNTNPKNTNFVQFYHKEKLMQQTLENFSPNLNTKCFEITEENIGIRADIFISQICGISRAKAQSYIKNAQVLLNNAPLQKHGITLKLHDTITLIPQEAPQQKQKKEFTIPILYEDEEILILNKPADLIVHRSDAKDTQYTLVDWILILVSQTLGIPIGKVSCIDWIKARAVRLSLLKTTQHTHI